MSGPRDYITNGRKSVGETFMAETQQQTDLDVLMECVRGKWADAETLRQGRDHWSIGVGRNADAEWVGEGPTEFNAALAAAETVVAEEGYVFQQGYSTGQWVFVRTKGPELPYSPCSSTRTLAILSACRDSLERKRGAERAAAELMIDGESACDASTTGKHRRNSFDERYCKYCDGVFDTAVPADVERVSGEEKCTHCSEMADTYCENCGGPLCSDHDAGEFEDVDTCKDGAACEQRLLDAERNTRPAPVAAPAEEEKLPVITKEMVAEFLPYAPGEHFADSIQTRYVTLATESQFRAVSRAVLQAYFKAYGALAPAPQGAAPAEGSIAEEILREMVHTHQDPISGTWWAVRGRAYGPHKTQDAAQLDPRLAIAAPQEGTPAHVHLNELPPLTGYAEMRQERDLALQQLATLTAENQALRERVLDVAKELERRTLQQEARAHEFGKEKCLALEHRSDGAANSYRNALHLLEAALASTADGSVRHG